MSTLEVAPRLLGEFVVPHDLSIGGTPVGRFSTVRDRRSGRYMMTGAGWDRQRTSSEDIHIDPRTGNLVWSYAGVPADEPTVWAPDGGLLMELGAGPADLRRTDDVAERPLEHEPVTRGEPTISLESATSTQPQLNEGIRPDGIRCLEATDVAAMRSVLGAPINTVRRTLLADLADRGVPDPDNFEGMTQGPDLPTGERTRLLVSDNDVRRELRTRVIAHALPPAPL